MGGARGTYRGQERRIEVVGKHEERDHMKELSEDERIILEWILKINRLGSDGVG
jgi:hypothetical protein